MDLDSVLSNINSVLALSSDGTDADRRHIAHNAPSATLAIPAYGGMYIAVALAWLYLVQGIAPTRWDMAGAGVALLGMAIIALQPSPRS
jgi:hypothetical protein